MSETADSSSLGLSGGSQIDPLSEIVTHMHPYMPMRRGEYRATDLTIAGKVERARAMIMRTRMVRDARETPQAAEYFEGIQEAFLASFEEITPDLLADSTKLNFVKCV